MTQRKGGRRSADITSELRYKEEAISEIKSDVRIIKLELMGDPSLNKKGMVADHYKNTAFRKISLKLWVGLWAFLLAIVPAFIFVFAAEVKEFIVKLMT